MEKFNAESAEPRRSSGKKLLVQVSRCLGPGRDVVLTLIRGGDKDGTWGRPFYCDTLTPDEVAKVRKALWEKTGVRA